MILDWSKVRIFVQPGPTDMRKQINGLSIIVEEDLNMDPFEGNLFMFCNKKKSRRLLEKLTDMRIRYLAQTDISVGEDIEFLELLKESGCAILFIGFESLSPS